MSASEVQRGRSGQAGDDGRGTSASGSAQSSAEAERRLRRVLAELEGERGGQRADMSDVTTRLKRIVRRNPRITQAALTAFRQVQKYDAWSQRTSARLHRRRLSNLMGDPAESPLAAEYRALIEQGQVVDPASDRNLAFCVSSKDPDSGRGDLYVAAGLARELRRQGWRTAFYDPKTWDLIPDGTNVVVGMVPAVDPRSLPPGALRVAWSRSFLDQWMAGDDAGAWDLWLAVSEVMAAQLRSRVEVPVRVLPIGVDPELFAGPELGGIRRGVVSTTNDFGGGRQLLRFLAAAGPPKSLVLYGVRRRRRRKHPRSLRRYEVGQLSYFAIPAVYQRAAVVLDDQMPGARAVGSLNSRIYEALAAGALPITNSSLALAGTGLEAVPTYRDAPELARQIAAHEAFGAETAALVCQLREVVLERHTFARRAEAFSQHLASGPRVDRRLVQLGFFPDYRQDNPYQSMLFSSARKFGVSLTAMENPVWDSPSDMAGAVRIWNLHWTAPIFAGLDSEEQARLRVQDLVDRLRVFRAEGGKVVWTVHNRAPHENKFPAAQQRLQQALAELSDHVHVMCARTALELPALARVEPQRLLVLPHCGYVGWYPDAISQTEARRRLGIKPDRPVVGLIGGFRPYKGVERLLAALDRPDVAATGVEAIVAGKPAVHPETARLRKLVNEHPRIHRYLAFIPPEQLQIYIKAADVIVLPYMKTLNSGALLAALSFGRPVIAPRDGCLADILDSSFALEFDINDPDGFANALAKVELLRNPSAQAAARRFAESFTSEPMSQRFFEAVLARG